MVQTIRSLIYFIIMVLSILVFGLLIVFPGGILPVGARQALGTAWGRVNIWALKWIVGLNYEVKGIEHLPAEPHIVMSKHQSTWETITFRHILPSNQSWVLKRELMWVPVFGWALFMLTPIAIDRKAGKKALKQVTDQGLAALAKGRNVIIFPEGTRTPPGQHQKYNIGGAMLAAKAGVPVVPIAHNAGVFWARRGLMKHPGTIQVIIGEPISTEGKKAGDIMGEVETWIEGVQGALPLNP